MSNSILAQDRADAHALSQLTDAHTALNQCEGRRAAAKAPELERIATTLALIERQITTLRGDLSPAAAGIYKILARAKRLPFTSRMEAGACFSCHMRVPSALAAVVTSRGRGLQCPSCARLLVPVDEPEHVAAS